MTDRWEVERAVLNSRIDSRGRLIVLALLAKVDNATAQTSPEHTPAFSTLCAMTGLSSAVVSEWMQALIDGGWVTRIKASAGSGRGNRTRYALHCGADKIERRSRDLRVPRKKKNRSPSEPFGEAPESPETVRPANGSEEKPFAQRTPNRSPGEPFKPVNPSPGERATTLRTTKNHQGAAVQPKLPLATAAKSTPERWAKIDNQPRTDGTRVPRQPSLADVRRAEIERAPEATKVIGRWLHANGYPHATAADAGAVLRAVIAAYPAQMKGPGNYLAGIASGSGFAQFYQPIIEARADEINKKVRALTEGQPDCGHGYPGGNLTHPTTGTALCPRCRIGAPVPVQRGAESTHPDVKAALDAYRAAYRNRFGATPRLPLLITLTAEAETMRLRGLNPDRLVAIAAAAGRTGSQLLETARSMKGQPV